MSPGPAVAFDKQLEFEDYASPDPALALVAMFAYHRFVDHTPEEEHEYHPDEVSTLVSPESKVT